MQLSRAEIADLTRSAGGLLLAAGAVVLFARKSAHHEWSELGRMLVVLLPAAALYLLAVGGADGPRPRGRPWRSVLAVSSILLWPVALLALLGWIGASANRHPIYAAAVFAATAALAAYAAWHSRVRYAALLSGLTLLLVWLYIWQAILGQTGAGTARWLMVAVAALLLGAAAALAHVKGAGAGEVATAGGIAAVAAGVIGVIVSLLASAGAFITSAGGASGAVISSGRRSLSPHHSAHRLAAQHHAVATHTALAHAAHASGMQNTGWNIYLLIVSLVLIWIAARRSIRGLGYVGGAGLLAFVGSVAAEVTRLQAGHSPTGSLLGWPLILIILGVAGLAAPVILRRLPSTADAEQP